jgi:hypothetical protein
MEVAPGYQSVVKNVALPRRWRWCRVARARHRSGSSGCFSCSHRFDHMFRNEGVTGSSPVSSTPR